jgi:hypothetical protein
MDGILYWLTLCVLWFCIGADVWVLIQNWRANRKLMKRCEQIDRLWAQVVVLRTKYERMIAYPERNLTDEND